MSVRPATSAVNKNWENPGRPRLSRPANSPSPANRSLPARISSCQASRFWWHCCTRWFFELSRHRSPDWDAPRRASTTTDPARYPRKTRSGDSGLSHSIHNSFSPNSQTRPDKRSRRWCWALAKTPIPWRPPTAWIASEGRSDPEPGCCRSHIARRRCPICRPTRTRPWES